MKNKKIALIILDGWGLGEKKMADAIQQANTPFVDSLYQKHPHSKLIASGEAVGLPEGQMGNSEVGHLTIGSGRVIFQELVKIHKASQNGELAQNRSLQEAIHYAKSEHKNVHIIGLLSDGGVHSHISHLIALCKILEQNGISKGFVHAFLDGRDTDPKSGVAYLKELDLALQDNHCKIASVIGRYYAMDRDKRWERVKMAYDLLVHGDAEESSNLIASVQNQYEHGVTDEFMKPMKSHDFTAIQPGDVVINFNFRTDRARQITYALTQEDFHEYNMHKMPLHYVCMTNYDESFKGLHVIFEKDNLNKTLGEVLSLHGKSQLRIAETEKYPHVTFFFSGGREKEFDLENRVMVPSPKVATYDLQPEMSAAEIKNAVMQEMELRAPDFICLNFANPDMVGHTGVFDAVKKAIETVDQCAKDIVEKGITLGYSFIIIADHGNADYMINEDGSPNTAHSTNLVPCILIDEEYDAIADGGLADVAPTILALFDIEQPVEMNGHSLLKK